MKGSRSAHENLVRACADLLRVLRIEAWRVNQRPVRLADGSWRSPGADKGLGDIVGVIPPHGRFLNIECKTGGAAPTKDQRAAAERIRASGGQALFVRDVRDLANFLGYRAATAPTGDVDATQ